MRVAGIFAGIGGLELGLEAGGHQTEFFCENDPAAIAVLKNRFPDVQCHDDIESLSALPVVDLVTAGFPCQDLSQAGTTNGIDGSKSGVVKRLFNLIEAIPQQGRPSWMLIENVPFMLQLGRGRAVKYVTDRLTALGYMWAYRVVDSRAFGLPHRRRRVLLLASRTGDPRPVLLNQDSGEPPAVPEAGKACGFYWTEGNRGVGWAVDAVPPLKGSSGLGIPSPPGIWMPDGSIVVPDIRDAERLQGFEADWTQPATGGRRTSGARWRLVGNAVSVPVSQWIGERLNTAEDFDRTSAELGNEANWPAAAWGKDGKTYRVNVSAWPVMRESKGLESFLQDPLSPLSNRAARGFLLRLKASGLRVPEKFVADLEAHVSPSAEATAEAEEPRELSLLPFPA